MITTTNNYGEQPTILNMKAGSGESSHETAFNSAVERENEKEDVIEEFPVMLKNGSSKLIQMNNSWTALKLVGVACKAFGMVNKKKSKKKKKKIIFFFFFNFAGRIGKKHENYSENRRKR